MKLPNLLNTLSGIWAILWTYITVIFLLDMRYSRRRTAILSAAVLLSIIALNIPIYGTLGSSRAGQISLLIRTIPMIVFFFAISKYRDARVIFTYFFVQNNLHEIIVFTNIANNYLTPKTYYINFLGRLILYPLISWLFWRKIRKPYQDVLNGTVQGWFSFALIAVMFYIMQSMLFNHPTAVTDRPAELPSLFMFMLLSPLTFWWMFYALFHQQELYGMREREKLLDAQTDALEQRMEQSKASEKKLSIQRHDLRHRFFTLRTLLENEETKEALNYVDASAEMLADITPRRWCDNTVLDAMFSSYFAMAEAEDIRVEAQLDIPESPNISSAELSTVFANAIENAINAVRTLPKEERVIRCECIRRPQLMFCISNPYKGEIHFDSNGKPVNSEKGHGLGIASITAYCEKHGAFCDYETDNGWFVLRMVQP